MRRMYQLAFTAAIISVAAIVASPGLGQSPASVLNSTNASHANGSPAAPLTVKQMLETANAEVPRITPAQAKEMIAKGNTLVLDVRDASEVAASGKALGAVNVSRGMLEFAADPESPYHNKSLAKDKAVIVYCSSGARAALASKTLKDMGYPNVFNVGGFKDWVDSGGAVEPSK